MKAAGDQNSLATIRARVFAVVAFGLTLGAATAGPKLAAEPLAPEETLETTATDAAAAPRARILALQRLEAHSAEAAADVALRLLADSDEQVSAAAAQTLAQVSAPPSAVDQRSIPAAASDTILSDSLRAQALDTLRGALWSEHQPVRTIAAQTLATRNDLQSLTRVHEGVSRGLYSEQEAIAVFALADPVLAAKYQQWYLAHGSDAAKIAVVPPLASNPSNHRMLREQYLENPDVAPSVREAIARALAAH